MSLIKMAERNNTANQLITWNEQCRNAMSVAKSTYTSIAVQLEAMKTNSEYTEEDVAEVEAMLTELNMLAVSLTV